MAADAAEMTGPERLGPPENRAGTSDDGPGPPAEVRVRVLLVEDDEDDYLITRDMLDAFESVFELEWCATYEAALLAIRERSHDVYLIDYHLGSHTGLQLMREGFAERSSAPAIMLTGQPSHEIDLEATALGVTNFLVKQELTAVGLERSIRYAISHQKAERHALAARAANDGIWDWNLETDRIYVSPRWHTILGLTARARELAPSAWFERIAPEDRPRVQDAIAAHLDGRTSHLECEHRLRHASGEWRWVLARGLVTRDVDGRPLRLAGSMSDMTAQRTNQMRLEHEALHDTLTGLPNRNLFMDRVAQLIGREMREPEMRCAVLFLDLDGFKAINDRLSHAVGDKLLIAVAERLQTVLRPGDTVARLGGDEFTLLLDRIPDAGEASDIARRVLECVERRFAGDGADLAVGASIGIALSSYGGDAAQLVANADAAAQLVANADAAMYEAKRRGRGCIAVFDETMRRREADRLVNQDELCRILDDGRLEIHFQPIVELDTGHLRALEALARWPQDDPAAIVPAELIALAEEAGLVGELGYQVLSGALRTLAEWRRAGQVGDDVVVTVNLSAQQLGEPELTEYIQTALAEADLPPEALKLEISEQTMMDLERSERFAELAARGIGLHVDDFGTGYTSLAALHRLPVHAIKVDGSFVAALDGGDGEADAVLRAAIALGRVLELPVIAEGIESAAVLDRLRELGCPWGQGRFISPPQHRLEVPLGRRLLDLAAR